MKRVTGIGGIFFKSADPKALGAWYRDHLGLDVTDWGGVVFQWGGPGSPPGMTLWSPFAQDTDYMAPSTSSFTRSQPPASRARRSVRIASSALKQPAVLGR
mgnify:CR=1 FL=1